MLRSWVYSPPPSSQCDGLRQMAEAEEAQELYFLEDGSPALVAQLKEQLLPILELCIQAQYLAAKVAFDAFFSQHKLGWRRVVGDEVPADALDRFDCRVLQTMLFREREAKLVLSGIDLTAADSNVHWILASNHGGISCHYFVAEDGIITVRMAGNLNDLPLFEQAATIHEVDCFKVSEF